MRPGLATFEPDRAAAARERRDAVRVERGARQLAVLGVLLGIGDVDVGEDVGGHGGFRSKVQGLKSFSA